MNAEISYSKRRITVYRTCANMLAGMATVPGSTFIARDNRLFAVEIDFEILRGCFLSTYTHGDNRNLVTTDSIKNFVLQQALEFNGSTLEGFLAFLSERFLTIYPQVQALRITGKEHPFNPVLVPGNDGENFVSSNVLFSRSHNDYAVATLEMERDGDGTRLVAHQCGRKGLQLIKITGSSFENFVQDSYTTLQEQVDRPLFIYLDVSWKYTDITCMIDPTPSHYIAAEQVRDVVQNTFHRFVSKSIQHLTYEMGIQMLEQFVQMAEVSFVAQNRLWETACVSETDPKRKVYTDPRPAYGEIKLTLTRNELVCINDKRRMCDGRSSYNPRTRLSAGASRRAYGA